ncbi:Uncharacterized protein Rs2_38076 [Raphanus sativus]|nr:Uncharacterized protein Rs2_38076 [Raphanus sativus]
MRRRWRGTVVTRKRRGRQREGGDGWRMREDGGDGRGGDSERIVSMGEGRREFLGVGLENGKLLFVGGDLSKQPPSVKSTVPFSEPFTRDPQNHPPEKDGITGKEAVEQSTLFKNRSRLYTKRIQRQQ